MNRLFSDHLPIPAPAVKRRYENRGADWWRCLRVIYRPYPTPGFRLSPESPWPCEGRNKRMKIAGRRGSLAGKTLRPYGVPHPWTPAPYLGTGHAFDRRSDELGVYSHSNRSCRLAPAHQGMKSRSCGLVPRIGTADSATPHPTPAGDKPPRYIFSFRHRPSVYNSARFARGGPALRLIWVHIFVRMTAPARLTGAAYFPTNARSAGQAAAV